MKYGKVELQLEQGSFAIDSPPILSGTGGTEDITAADTVISGDYLNRLCRVNVASCSKIYLPSMNEASDGNRLTIQNTSTSNYFWLFQNSDDGYSIDGNNMILVPPKATVELIFAYEASQWAEIGGRILCNDLTVDIYSDFYNETKLFEILRSLPSKGIDCLLELDFHYDTDGGGNPVETIFNVDPVNEEYSSLQIYGYYVIINGIDKNYSKIRVNSAKISDGGGNVNGLFIGIKTKMDKILLKNFTIQKNFVLTGANPNESHGGLLRTKGCSVYICKFESIVTDSYENTLPALNIRGDVLVRSCSFVDNFGSAVCSVYFGNTVTVDNTSIASTIKQGFRASFGSRIVDGYANVNQAISPYYKLFGGQIILPNGQAWKSNFDIVALRTYLSTSQSIPNDTITKIAFDSIEFDVNSDWDTTNYKFVCQKRGIYEVKLHGYLIYVGAQHRFYLYIYKNGSSYSKAMFYNKINANTDMTTYSTTTIFLEEGDVIEFYALQDSGSTQTLNNGRIFTFATITLIHELDS